MMIRFFILAISLAASLPTVAASCLHYSGSSVTLAGKVKLQKFFGPPNFGENPDTDSHEVQAILLLAKPICVDENPKDYEKAEQNQMQVTLVPLHHENLRNYEGKQIIVQGTLYHAHTGHHHTPVLMEIKRIEYVSK